MGSELVLWTTCNGYLTVSSIKININNVCWEEQEGTVTPRVKSLEHWLEKVSIG